MVSSGHNSLLESAKCTSSRSVCCAPKRHSVTFSASSQLHWLPIDQRFKILLLTYKSVNHLAPAYLSELVSSRRSARTRRSSVRSLIIIPPTTPVYCDRAFSVSAQKIKVFSQRTSRCHRAWAKSWGKLKPEWAESRMEDDQVCSVIVFAIIFGHYGVGASRNGRFGSGFKEEEISVRTTHFFKKMHLSNRGIAILVALMRCRSMIFLCLLFYNI